MKEPEVTIVWEKKPTPEEERKAKSLQLPPTFFCGVGTDSDTEKDKAEDFEAEVQKVQEAMVGLTEIEALTTPQHLSIDTFRQSRL